MAAAAPAPAGRLLVDEEDKITGELPPKVLSIFLRFADLPQEEIVRIFQNIFKLINLYRLRHMRGLRFQVIHDKNCISVKDGMLKLRKISGTYKDFSKSFYEIWADIFYNYTTIFVSFFDKEVPNLHSALAKFYMQIYEFSTIYEWQETVLLMAIKAYIFVVIQQLMDPSKWVIPEKFQGRFCMARTMIGMSSMMGGEGLAQREGDRGPS